MSITTAQPDALLEFARRYPRLFVLTGAGVSTASGIPGYRDADGNWRSRQPITHQDFVASDMARRRYWARSLTGWPVMAGATPNAAHQALARLERAGHIGQLVTQNVDGLHARAGSANVIDLHGRLRDVVCMECGAMHARAAMQTLLKAANPGFAVAGAVSAPDGDADVEVDFSGFDVPPCPACGGVLKPDVVFFGDSVPQPRAKAAMDALVAADAVLVAGSSLMVRSGFRFCEAAHAAGKPIAAINLGRTRADGLLALKVEMDCCEALGALADQINR